VSSPDACRRSSALRLVRRIAIVTGGKIAASHRDAVSFSPGAANSAAHEAR